MGPHVDRAVRGELGGVDEDAAAGGVDHFGRLMHRLHDARDVRRAGEGEESDAPGVLSQATIEIVDIQRAVRDRRPRAPCGDALATASRSSGVRAWSSAPLNRTRPATLGRAC